MEPTQPADPAPEQALAPDQPAAKPVYATAEQALAWKSPDPLTRDYVHSETGQTFRLAGLCKAKDRKAIYAERMRLLPSLASMKASVGYAPTDSDLTDACWCAECITAPKMTAFQWLQFGAEASLGELARQALITSRIIEERDEDAPAATVPDGTTAAEAQLTADPT